ncbi:unnamed protein product [Caenorhabditis angaria]|uniref:Uncharacterized protein n=1 Tax=Caenorhabditis angaria TaxID=860376 RepID=A0A9P1IF31_9PELO|nr:unnamed protein product [Caenorhabditis angaria]
MMKIFILLILITPTISQRYADSCIKLLDQNQAKDLQSFANETIYHNLYYKSNINSFMTIGSGIIEDRLKYVDQKYWSSNRSLVEEVSEDTPGDQGVQWRQIAGEEFVGKVFEKSDRYQWICPANFYSSIFNESFNMFDIPQHPDNSKNRIKDPSLPLTHNYFVNIRLNSHLNVYAGYGGIVVHSVDLNGFQLWIYVPSGFYQKHLKSESIPDIQITNNYGPGTINIRCDQDFEHQKFKHRRNILHGGNENDVIIHFYDNNEKERNFSTFNMPISDSNPTYQTKSGEESTKKHQKQKNWSYSDILVICGLICFIFSLFFLILPFFVAKNNDFHLLDYYDYYQEIDELQ